METYGPDDYKVAIAQGRRGRNQPKSRRSARMSR